MRWLLVVLILLVAPAAAAAPDAAAIARARSEFQQALAAQNSGDWAGALVLLQRVSQVSMTPQVRFNIALCEEHLGRLTVALGDYEIAASEATAANVEAVASEAKSRARVLRARIPKVVLERGRGPSVGTFVLDGTELGASVIGTELPVDPGPHRLEVRVAGTPPKTMTFEVAEGERKVVEAAFAEEQASTMQARPMMEHPGPRETTKPSVLPWVVGGAGLASLGASGAFALLQSSAQSDLDAVCGSARDACPASSRSTYDDAKTYNTLARVTLAVGVAGVVAAAILFFTDPGKKVSSRGQRAP